MKFGGEVVEILEAYDLTGSYRAAAELAGCSHSTVARYVAAREAGQLEVRPARRPRLLDEYLEKLEEWVNVSHGRVRGDVAYQKLRAMGFLGSERTVRRTLAEAKDAYRQGRRRVYRPWVAEPGLWFQWDYGRGPEISGRSSWLFCAWLAWSRYRVVIPILDKSQATVIWCLDRALRRFGGCPTYGLGDNEKTLTVEHVAGIPIREAEMAAAGRFYGISLRSCVPYDPESKGGSESVVRLGKADLVPTEANLRDQYGSLGELEVACQEVELGFNGRPHRVTRRVPAEMLQEERERLHPLPAEPYTRAFGESRRVAKTSTVTFQGGEYSAPYQLVGEAVWVRGYGDQVVMVHLGKDGAREVARHQRTTPGHPRLDDDHYPERHQDPLQRQPRPGSPEEADFLRLGPEAGTWLVAAGEVGASRVRVKMALAVSLSKIFGSRQVAEALGQAASSGRFGEGDLESILQHLAVAHAGAPSQPSESHSLQLGTGAWAVLRS